MATPSKRSPVAPGQKLAGKYRVEREIGAGSMGVVVEAWHIELDQRVAIKFLYPEFASNQEGAERFRREARAAARIESEHVAKVLDIGTLEEGRTLFYVMEFLRGHDLSRELSLHGPLPVQKAVDHVVETCQALAEAHAKGIVHRDLKPANLFLVDRPNGDQMVKVVDFGISKITGGTTRQFSLTDTSIMMGSPAYMCPEQLESSRSVDGRADIWSLGVILHELILDQIPFRGDSVPQLVGSILLGKRVPLTSRPGVPAELEAVVERCLRQNRDERFATIEELHDALIPFATLGRRSLPSRAPAALAASSAALAREGWLGSTPVASSLPSLSTPSAPAVTPPKEPARPAAALASHAAAPLSLAAEGPPALGREERAGLQSGTDPISWAGTQRGQSWRQAMYRRGLPAALLLTLALGGVYWALSAQSIPAAKSPSVASVAAELERANLPAEPAEKPAVEPLIRALQPAAKAEGQALEPGSARPPAPPDALEPAPARPPPPEPRAPEGTRSANPAARAGSIKAPAAATRSGVERPAPTSTSQDPGDNKQNRPGFLRKLDSQDYGGRE